MKMTGHLFGPVANEKGRYKRVPEYLVNNDATLFPSDGTDW
jgi:hypothetical protein